MYQMMQSWWGGGMMGWGGMWLVFWITAILSWTVLVLLIVALIRWINKK